MNVNKYKSKTPSSGFVQVPDKLIFDNGLTDSQFRTLLALRSYQYDDRDVFPSQNTLANRRNKTRETINSHIQKLAKYGYLSIKRIRFSMNNRYKICEENFTCDEMKTAQKKSNNFNTNNTKLNHTNRKSLSEENFTPVSHEVLDRVRKQNPFLINKVNKK